MADKQLPRILYLSDVPVELSYAGATLMYRLLEHYPKEKLLIIQGTEMNSKERIAGVNYITTKSAFLNRLKTTRFSKRISGLLIAKQYIRSGKLLSAIKEFKPDVILTVSFRLMWLKAFRLSKHLNIPLHLILHDDWLTTENYGIWQKHLAGLFGQMYRHSSGRFCICPAMEKYYHALYEVHGEILYPLRGRSDLAFPVVGEVKRKKNVIKYCYAGSLFTGDFAVMLNEIASIISKQNGEMHIFSHKDKAAMEQYEYLMKPHVKFHDLIHPAELMRFMNEEIDVGILLNSFDHEEMFKYNFSSKLVDYTSAGLPVLIWGPQSSGVISWALASGYTGVVIMKDSVAVADLIDRLKDDEVRLKLARNMKGLGTEQFSYENNYKKFIRQISI
ncbi:hypothetical protein BH11BAC4_BH11BAC4_01200 [soil metagenome]